MLSTRLDTLRGKLVSGAEIPSLGTVPNKQDVEVTPQKRGSKCRRNDANWAGDIRR
jgi:hypothetical protein